MAYMQQVARQWPLPKVPSFGQFDDGNPGSLASPASCILHPLLLAPTFNTQSLNSLVEPSK